MAAGADRFLSLSLGRTAMVLLLLLSFRAHADIPPDQAFDQVLAAQVFTAALSFMAPRTLDPVPMPQMTIWGLRGITALDPGLVPVLHDADLTLNAPGRVLAVLKLPATDDIAGWGGLAAAVSATAYRNSDALRRAGTQGMIVSFFDEVFNHLDPYSRYVAPAEAIADREHRSGQAGIGVTLSGHPGNLIFADVIADGPAAVAGLRQGDRLLAIAGRPLGRDDPNTAMSQLDGNEGDPVTITLRAHDGHIRSVRLERALVPAETVYASHSGNLLLLRVTGFTASTAERLQHELGTALDAKPQISGIVMDLRGNRGGLLVQAVEAANLVLTSGLIATTEGRAPAANHSWTAAGTDLADGLPIVVMVDGRSASAAEILAAALSDDGRAVVIGSSTLGKGLVQTVTPLPDNGELFVTWSRVLAPRGWPLQGLGVMPQVCTSLGADSTKQQLDALGGGTQTLQQVLALHRAARPGIPLAEMLAIRDACPAALGRDNDLDTARFLIGNPVAYASALAPM